MKINKDAMNSVNKVVMIAAICTIALKATGSNEMSWLIRAQHCDNTLFLDYDILERSDFTLRDEQGKNIYQIALEKYKATGSIPCAKMAVMLEYYEKKIREEFNNEMAARKEISEKLDEVEKTFEISHKSEN